MTGSAPTAPHFTRPVSAPPGGLSAKATNPNGPGKTGSGWGDLANDAAFPRWMSEYYAGRPYRERGAPPDDDLTEGGAALPFEADGFSTEEICELSRHTIMKVPSGPSFSSLTTTHAVPDAVSGDALDAKRHFGDRPAASSKANTGDFVPEQMKHAILRRLRDLEAENNAEKRRLLMLRAENEELRSLQVTAHFGNNRCLRAEAAETRVERLRQETRGLEERLQEAKQARNKMIAKQRE